MFKIFVISLFFYAHTLFAQTDLNYYINIAKQNSPLINDNQNLSKANQLEVERLKAFYTKPQIGLSAVYMFSPILNLDNTQPKIEVNPLSSSRYIGYDFAAANGGQYQALLNVYQPLFGQQRYKSASETFQINAAIYQNNSKISAHDIEKIVGDQYILCVQDLQQLTYVNSIMVLLVEQKDIVKKLVENSIFKQSDYTLLTIEYQNMLGLQTTFLANYRRDLMDLNILSGISDTSFIQIKQIQLLLTPPVNYSAFTERYKLDSLNLQALQKSFELKYKPQLSLFANTGLNAIYAPTIPNRFGLSAGLNFTYNFFDGHQKSINRKKTDVLLNSVSFSKETFNRQNNIRKAKILNELLSFNERLLISEQQLKEYETLMNAYKREILSGQLSIINYIAIIKNKAMVQRDYTLLIAQKQVLINAYNYWNW